MRKLLRSALGVVAVAAVACLLIAAPAGASGGTPTGGSGNSQVHVVHGIPGQPVDVYVNGAKVLDNFQPGAVAGPLSLPAGSYTVALTKPGEPVGSAILSKSGLAVPAGANISLVANLDTSGQPALNAFVNDTSAIPAGKARLTVRHTADAPAVDVRANGAVVFANLTNPNQAQADVPAGTVDADVTLAGTNTVVLGPQKVTLAAGTQTILYAIGSANAKTLALVSQVLNGTAGAPSGVPAGARRAGGVSTWPYALLVAGGLLIAGGAFIAVRRRSAAR